MPRTRKEAVPPCWRGRDDPSPFVPGLPEVVPSARSLTALFRAMKCCTRCELAAGRNRVVVGVGPASAEVMFIGEAPGAQEDAAGRPFAGAAGRYLDTLLAAHGIVRDDVFVTNVVACRPPANRTPRPREVAAHAPWLEEQIRLVEPRIIVTLGRAALTYFIRGAKITQLSGVPQPLAWQERELTLLPLFHPAAALRAPDLRPRLDEGFAALAALLASARAGRRGPRR